MSRNSPSCGNRSRRWSRPLGSYASTPRPSLWITAPTKTIRPRVYGMPSLRLSDHVDPSTSHGRLRLPSARTRPPRDCRLSQQSSGSLDRADTVLITRRPEDAPRRYLVATPRRTKEAKEREKDEMLKCASTPPWDQTSTKGPEVTRRSLYKRNTVYAMGAAEGSRTPS